ncbi:HNH endonuclease signature motif containing protein [Nocardioides terrisoli]|uniref:HNH endonuclease signature motif containing protein n=1 Tax=Nocardioides terrisoli TaxID=3388267 RepID=UPI00287B6E53|nr:DUF222 domain-containing protein [Nocardioides marmorisolisilvae]
MTAPPLPKHPILACVSRLRNGLDEVVDVQATYLSTEEKAAALRELAVVESRVAGLRLKVMAAAADVAEIDAARDVGAWYAHHTRNEADSSRADARLARSLDRDRLTLADALAGGRCNVAQARVIDRALDALPDRLGRELLERAEATLVGYAAELTPGQLRRVGRRILDLVAPEVAEEEEGRRLADEERHAREKTQMSLRPLGDGTTRISGRLPESAARRLCTYLESFASPRHLGSEADNPQPPIDRVPYPRRLGEAFCSLLEHLDPEKLPDHGGDATTVLITLSLDQLRAELAAADLLGAGDGDSDRLSAGEVRRLACNARLVPVVLGSRSEVLDLGRSSRLFTRSQHKALRLRDRGCRAEDCTIPAAWTEAHHDKPWAAGGSTNLEDGVLLCSHHHHLAHDPRFTACRLPNGDVRFVRRT